MFKHIAASPRILSYDYFRAFLFLAQMPSQKSSYFICMLHCQIDICLSAEAVSAKIFSHD